MKRIAAAVSLLAWIALLGAALLFLHRTPPSAGISADGSTHVIAGVRYLALGLGWYLAATTLMSSVAHLLRAAGAITLTARLTAGPIHRLTRAAVGAAMTAAALVPAAAAAQATEQVPVMTWVDEEPQPLPDAPLPPPGAAPRPPQAPRAPAAVEREVVVAPGDHLWSLASTRMAEHLGREPSDRELTPYWAAVVRANRTRLRDAAVPDLIFPGDLVTLPAP